MSNVLYLVHRLPYPPNKGDKVRSFHLLKHLARSHNVYLGTFVDDPDDEQYVETVRSYCADLHVARLNPKLARLRSLNGLVNGDPLSLPYYRDAKLQRWVNAHCREKHIDAVVIFSSAMGQYVDRMKRLPMLVDFVDVDSAKWTQYASSHRGPKAWIYRREGELLLAYERDLASASARSFFVTENETELFRKLAPECSTRVQAMCNGVDSDFFAPNPALANPFSDTEIPVVFTGAMDYHPNEDAAVWFIHEALPLLRAKWPAVRFHVVGRSPPAALQALAGEAVNVTGTVPDVRPYLQHAAVVVAPLRIARGIQNKILEAMAMARPVVASAACAGGVNARPGEEFLIAGSGGEFAERIGTLLGAPESAEAIAQAGRQCVLNRYSWDAHLAGIDRYLNAPESPQPYGAGALQ